MTADATPNARILLIEDDEHISLLLKLILERRGHVVTSCTDGRAARELIEGGAPVPNLILLDVLMPYLDGFELVGLIRALPEWKSVPIVMLTAKTSETDIERALEAGANDYIIKPFQPNELLARLTPFLG